MKPRSILICAILGVCLGAAQAQPAPTYDALIQQGKVQLQAGNSAQALATGKQAIQLDTNRWEAYALAGGALMNLRRYEEAADNLSDAIKHAPEAKQDGLRALRKQCALAEAGVAPPAPQSAPAASPEQTTTQAEVVLWKTITNSTNPDDFKTYLQTYPNGAFAPLAQRQLAAFEKAAEEKNANMQQARRLLEERKSREHAAELDGGVWSDPDTRLMWMKKDNLGNVNWQQAIEYCQASHFAGFDDWRLPTIDELKSLVDPTVKKRQAGYIKGNLQPTGAEWSSSPGKHQGLELCFILGDGLVITNASEQSNHDRVFCVRNRTE
ncbi:MAG: DUF1566 domain-containing protein [Terracidiphilus sp.]|jgi:tetratricopeptide (TPR) repeat protein